MPATRPYQWKRETRVAGHSLTTQGEKGDLHQNITVTQPEKDKLTATCEFWNLARETWNSVEQDQPVEVDLGYVGGPLRTVLLGSVTKVASPEAHGADTKYRLEAQDKSEGRIRATRFSKTWNQPTVGTVVRGIAAQADVGVARCDAPSESFDRRYPIDKSKPANRWLDRMKSEAEERDPEGRTYQWKAMNGQLYFWPQETARENSAVVLKKASGTQSGNIKSLDKSEGKTDKSDGPPDLDFQATLDPRLHKDGLVNVQGTDYDGVYRVTKYTMNSSVTGGSHEMSGTLSNPSSKFRVPQPDGESSSGGGHVA